MLGVDDFAAPGRVYGTVLVDVYTRRAVDLLDTSLRRRAARSSMVRPPASSP
jgi:hypothetical protein